MTRETAKRKIEMLDSYLQRKNDYGESDHEAMMMAIEALSQESCEDAISRKKIEKLKRWRFSYDTNTTIPKSDLFVKLADIRALPSVQSKPKTGHWILQPSNKEQGERDFIWWKCSECGRVIYSETEKDRRKYHAFCGRCGKRMIEPQESEETDADND